MANLFQNKCEENSMEEAKERRGGSYVDRIWGLQSNWLQNFVLIWTNQKFDPIRSILKDQNNKIEQL